MSTKNDETTGWLREAACTDIPLDAFFVEAGRVIDTRVLETCKSCPVRVDCLTYAYERGYTSGYFGGISPGVRRQLSLTEALASLADDDVEVEEAVEEDTLF